jgi:hypothetical protein
MPQGATQTCAPPAPQMSPARFDLAVYAGDSYSWLFVIWSDDTKTTPVDLTGATAASQVRDAPEGTVLATLACVITLPNQVLVTLGATDSETLAAGVWDLQLTAANGWVTTFVSGKVYVSADVTE